MIIFIVFMTHFFESNEMAPPSTAVDLRGLSVITMIGHVARKC